MSTPYEKLMADKKFLPAYMDHLTPEMMQIAKEELCEDEDTRDAAIEQLRKLIKKEKKLRCRTDDEYLLQYLRARKFNMEKAFSRFQSFYKVMSKSFPDVYNNLEVEKATYAFTSGFGCHLPYRNKDGAVVLLYKMENWQTEKYDVLSILNCITAVVLSALEVPATQVCGIHLVTDTRGTTLKHMTSLSPRYLNLISKGLRDTFPVLIAGVHLLNASSIFRYLWSIINIFLSEKIRSRVHFHEGNLESLHKHISKEILPIEYGGDMPNFDPVALSSPVLEKYQTKYLKLVHDGYVED